MAPSRPLLPHRRGRLAIMGFIAPSIVQDWGISRASFGLFMSAAPIGQVLGALITGPSLDRLGRKKVLIASVLLFGVFTIITAYTQIASEMSCVY